MALIRSPRNGIRYLEDGSEENIGRVNAAIRTFDIITNMVLQSIDTTATPEFPQPGQAWFVDKDAAVSGSGWTSILPTEPRDDHVIVAYVGLNSIEVNTPEVQFGWVVLQIDTSAVAYVVDRGARYQFDGEDWTEQLKSQSSIWRKSYPPSGTPLGSPGAENYLVLVAPFDIKFVGARFSLDGGAVVTNNTERAAFCPGMYYSTDPNATFPSAWTTIVDPTFSTNDGWSASTMEDFSDRAYTTSGVTPKSTAGNLWVTTVVPAGAYVVIGGWDSASNSPVNTLGTNFEIATIRQATLRLDYIRN